MTQTTDPRTIYDFPDPFSRAQFLAESVGVNVADMAAPDPEDQLTQDLLALLFRAVTPDGEDIECVLLRPDLSADERAAGLFFALSIVTVVRDVDPTAWDALHCRLDAEDDANNFIAIGRKRLPKPEGGGFGRLAAMMGEAAGLEQPAVFEVMGTGVPA